MDVVWHEGVKKGVEGRVRCRKAREEQESQCDGRCRERKR